MPVNTPVKRHGSMALNHKDLAMLNKIDNNIKNVRGDLRDFIKANKQKIDDFSPNNKRNK